MSLISGTKGQLLRVSSFTSSGTWTKQNDVGMVHVKVVGGGGGGGGGAGSTDGGSSSFGAYCVAGGGTKGTTSSAGVGGSASGGTINLTGMTCFAPYWGGAMAFGYFGKYGYGAQNTSEAGGWGGGSGGYSEKLINESDLVSSISVTVGAAGSGGALGYLNAGGAGIVFVYEYSK